MPTPSESSKPPSAKANLRSSQVLDLEEQATLKSIGAGSLLFGRYELIRVLGRGGMGIVWLATDTKLEREIALKFLPDLIGTDAVALGELKSETRRGLELAHPNIVRIYDFLDDHENAAISMEFIDGKTLSEARLSQPHRVFNVATLTPWICQICDALNYAHTQKKIVHRDLKPANFMLGKDQVIKIADFGIARSVTDTMSRLTGYHGGASGTLMYMSPQQTLGDRPSATDDIYSLGATLYELLTGKPPFYTGDISLQITTKTPPTMEMRRDELSISSDDVIPQNWESTIAACLEKDPSKRPQSALELAHLLELPSTSRVTSTSRITTTSQEIPVTTASTEALTEFSSKNPTEASETTATFSPKKSKRLRWVILCLTAVAVVIAAMSTLTWMPAPPPSPKPASLSIKTNPPGASFTLDGKAYTTPTQILEITPGNYEVKFSLTGHEPLETEFELLSGDSATPETFNLIRSTGKLAISASPKVAEFTLKSISDPDFKPIKGNTPASFDLVPGKYEIAWSSELESGLITQDIEANKFYSQNFTIHPRPSLPELTESLPSSKIPLLDDLTPLKELITAEPPKPIQKNLADAGPLPPESKDLDLPQEDLAWSIDEIFIFSPYQQFSENGRRYILSLVQQSLKKTNQYSSTIDGRTGKGTHMAIQAFQSENNLAPTGLLEESTLQQLGFTDLKDTKDWVAVKRTNRSNRSKSKEEPQGWWSKNVGGFVKKIFNK